MIITSTNPPCVQNFEDSILASFSADCVMYKCDWNKEDETLIERQGKQFAFVINEKGLLVGKFRHPDNCFGCQWKVGDRSLFVTGCYDGIVRILILALLKSLFTSIKWPRRG